MHERILKIALGAVAVWAAVATWMLASAQPEAPTPATQTKNSSVRHADLGFSVTCPDGLRVRASANGIACVTDEDRWMADVRAEPTESATVTDWIAAQNAARDPKLQLAVLGNMMVDGTDGFVAVVTDGYESAGEQGQPERTWYAISNGTLYALSYRMSDADNERFLMSFTFDK